MPKPFDVATKQLVETDPLAWLRFLGLPGTTAELIDADLTTVVAEADRLVKVTNPNYLLHFELQSSYKVSLGNRTFFYNAVTYYKYNLPVESVVVLLRKEADGPALSGEVSYGSLQFRYRVVRLWEFSPEELLSAPLALLPLAPLTSVSESELPSLIQTMEARIEAESPETRNDFWTITWLLLGLKYDSEFAKQLLKGVMAMKESTTYQYTLEEGRQLGLQEEARRLLVLMGERRLGQLDAGTQTALDATLSLEELERLLTRLLEVETWQELLGSSKE